MDTFLPLMFPSKGVDVSPALSEQPEGTTAVATNVRAYDPSSQRQRGAARPGLVQYLPQLPEGNHPIQLLDFIVDPTEAALTANFPDDDLTGDDFTDDDSTSPSNNPGNRHKRRKPLTGRRIHKKGDGHRLQLNIQKGLLTITADDITKKLGDTYTFTGKEYTQMGLGPIDTIESVTLTSKGAPASATVGVYPIKASNAHGKTGTDLSVHPGNLAKKYRIKYVDGKMRVGSAKCPWFGLASVNVKIAIDYYEATGPFNAINSPQVINTTGWPNLGTVDGTETSGNMGGFPGYGSAGNGQAQVTLAAIDSDPTNPAAPVGVSITATLIRLGLGPPFDTLPQSVVQTQVMSCPDFTTGHIATFTWIGTVYPIGPIGLVMGLTISVQKA